jgi:hypothetical protein
MNAGSASGSCAKEVKNKIRGACSADRHDTACSYSPSAIHIWYRFVTILVPFWCAFGPLFVMYHALALVPYNTHHGRQQLIWCAKRAGSAHRGCAVRKDVTAVFERRPYRFLAGALLFIRSKLTLLAFFLNCQPHDAGAERLFS